MMLPGVLRRASSATRVAICAPPRRPPAWCLVINWRRNAAVQKQANETKDRPTDCASQQNRLVDVGDGSSTSFQAQVAHFRFSNRPFEVKRFQTIHHHSFDVARRLVLLSGIGTKALPLWGSRRRWNNLSHGLAVRRTAGSSGSANSPHPSSREGHHSTARWSSSFLLLDLILKRLLLSSTLLSLISCRVMRG